MEFVFEPVLADCPMPSRLRSVGKGPVSLKSLGSWLEDNREHVNRELHRAGVLLLRDFPVNSAETFRAVCRTPRGAAA